MNYLAFLLSFLLASTLGAEVISKQRVTFRTDDGGQLIGELYGPKSDRCVVLAHGMQFNKESWEPQARQIVEAGFCVLAFDFRGYGDSHGPGEAQPITADLYHDVLGAVRYLRKIRSAKSVSVVGASMGASAVARASIEAREGEIERIVLIASVLDEDLPQYLKGRKLFIVAREDMRGDNVFRVDEISRQYKEVPDPKQLVVLEGRAHAQFLFETDQAQRLMNEIIMFLTAP